MIKLLSALPNSLLVAGNGYTTTVTSIDEEQVKKILKTNEWRSYVSHTSTAILFSERLKANVISNKMQVTLDYNDLLLVGLFTPSTRLAEGQLWTEAEILAMPINWVVVQKFLTETIQITQSDYSQVNLTSCI